MADKFAKKFNFGGEDDFYPLPIVTAEDNGKVMKVVDGEWGMADLISGPAIIEFTARENSSNSSNMITFQAEEGMTWAEWVETDYNTDDIL